MKQMFSVKGVALILAMAVMMTFSMVHAQSARAEAFEVEFAPVSTVFKVGQSIQFKVKGTQDFYLYLFSIDEKANRGHILVPNEVRKDNKFTAGVEHVVPGKGVQIVADQVGTERVIMLASTKPLTFGTDGLTASDSGYTGSAETVDNMVKALRVQAAKAEKVLKETTLVIISK